VAQGVDSEFKSQYYKKEKKERKKYEPVQVSFSLLLVFERSSLSTDRNTTLPIARCCPA
jgi:hypothetical protein